MRIGIKDLEIIRELDRIIANCVWQERDFWEGMFKLTRCGSGSENTVSGWITHLFKEIPKLAKPCNFSSQVAQIDYKQLDTGKEYIMKRGLFTSEIDGVILRPEFGCTVEEKKRGKR